MGEVMEHVTGKARNHREGLLSVCCNSLSSIREREEGVMVLSTKLSARSCVRKTQESKGSTAQQICLQGDGLVSPAILP